MSYRLVNGSQGCYTISMKASRRVYLSKYQKSWLAARRAAYFSDKQCVRCSSTTRLELDHIDPTTKVSSRIWSWKESRRLAELAKCQVLCHRCHKDKSAGEFRVRYKGQANHRARKLTLSQVSEIRDKLVAGHTYRSLAKEYGTSRGSVHKIKFGHTYLDGSPATN